MKEKEYKLTKKGEKLLKELNSNINMEQFAGELLGFEPKKDNNE